MQEAATASGRPEDLENHVYKPWVQHWEVEGKPAQNALDKC